MDDQFDPTAFKKPTRLSAQADDKHAFDPAAIKADIQAKAQREEDLLTAPLGPVPTWSFSRLMQYENCPYSVYLKSVMKCPDPSGIAAERGSLVHEVIENYIQCETDSLVPVMLPGMKKIDLAPFTPLIQKLRDDFSTGTVEVEGDWGFTRAWEPTDFFGPDAWGRMKLDAIDFEGVLPAEATSAVAHDWKTGRKFGNELKHNQQGMVYAIGAFMRYPNLQFIETQFSYLDEKDVLRNKYSRERAMLLKPMIDKRTNRMTTATEFPPKPSLQACKWCPHAKVQEGFDKPACEFAYQEL